MSQFNQYTVMFIFREEKEKKTEEEEKVLGVGFFQLVTVFFEHMLI